MASDGLQAGLLEAAFDSLSIELAVLETDGTIVTTTSDWGTLVEQTVLHDEIATTGDRYPAAIAEDSHEYGAYASGGLEALLNGDRDQFELEYPCDRSARQRWFSFIAQRVRVDGITYVTVAHREITERKRSEQAARQAHEIIVDTGTRFPDQVDQMLSHLQTSLSQDGVLFSNLTDDGHTVESVATSDGDGAPDSLPGGVVTYLDRIANAEQTLVFDDFDGSSGTDQFCFIGTPISAGGDIVGTLCGYSRQRAAADIAPWETTFVDHVARWLGSELERREYTDKLGALDIAFPDRGFVIDEDGRFIECLGTAGVSGIQDIDPDEFIGNRIEDIVPPDIADEATAAVRATIETDEFQRLELQTEVDGETKWFDARLAPLEGGYLGRRAVVSVVRDVTEQRQRERELARQRDKLAQLQRLDTLFREIIRALPETETRDEIEQAVCEHLTEAGLYEGVSVGVEDETGEFTVRYATGMDSGDAEVSRQTATRTLQIGEAEHETDCITVPIATGDTEYGVLVLQSPEDYTVTSSEQCLLQDLGEILALEIRRVHSQRSLAADTVLTLELRLLEADILGTATTADGDHEMVIEHRIPTDEGHLYYLRVDGDPETVTEQITSVDLVEDCRVVRESDDEMGAGIEVHTQTDEQTPFDVLIGHGASIQHTTVADGHMEITVEIHPQVGVRKLVEALQNVAPSTELLRKQVEARSGRTVPDVRDELSTELTEKQEAALRLAYARGYYEWPRDSTVDELAESMSITPSSLHYRLRRAHQSVIDTVLVGTTGTTPDG